MKEKMSTLKFWNKTNEKQTEQDPKTDAKNAKNGRNWLHSPETLTNGHVAYLVKFLGSTPVDQPKGIEVVKEAIRRLQFTQQIQKAENGNNSKLKKVEITISVDGVAVQEPRTSNILHQFPLHKISYCADEKGVKKFFSFIAKTGGNNTSSTNGDSNSINTSSSSSTTGTADETHECFVFISNKLASDITLTIGQAFDLAYRRYMSDSGKQFEISKLQSHNKHLENTVNVYRQRLRDMSEIMPKADLDRLLIRLGLRDICEVPPESGNDPNANGINGSKTPDLGIDVSAPNNDDQLLIETSNKHFAPIVPPRNIQSQINNKLEALKPSVGPKLEGLLLNSDSDSDFDPRAEESDNGTKVANDLFGFEPSKSLGHQLFTTGSFSSGNISNGTSAFNGLPPTSPPPLLAPPPKAAIPRRSASANNFTANGKSDPFGSDPFSPFDASVVSKNESSGFNSGSLYPNTLSNSSSNFQSQVVEMPVQSISDNSIKVNGTLSGGTEITNATSDSVALSNPFSYNHFVNSASSNDLESFSTSHNESPLKTSFSQNSFETASNKSDDRYEIFREAADFQSFSNEIANVTPAPPKPQVSPDLFKDFAAAAFNEFKTKNPPHEFANQMLFFNKKSPTNGTGKSLFGDQPKNSFKNGFNPDDFTLESLDPLK